MTTENPKRSYRTCQLQVAKPPHSQICGVCEMRSATLYTLRVGDRQFVICPFCKANLREDIKSYEGPDGY